MPTIADYAYGTESERQKFDFCKAESIKPTPVVVMIHGGGWTGGDKSGYQSKVIEPYLDAGISVAPINYRFIEQAMEQGVEPPVKACAPRRGPRSADDSREGEGMERRSEADRCDGRIGRRLHVTVAGVS